MEKELELLRSQKNSTQAELRSEIETLKNDHSKELELLRSQTNSTQAELRAEIETLKKDHDREKMVFEDKIKQLSKEMDDLKLELQTSKSEIVTYKV